MDKISLSKLKVYKRLHEGLENRVEEVLKEYYKERGWGWVWTPTYTFEVLSNYDIKLEIETYYSGQRNISYITLPRNAITGADSFAIRDMVALEKEEEIKAGLRAKEKSKEEKLAQFRRLESQLKEEGLING